jgi:hypothetical protein
MIPHTNALLSRSCSIVLFRWARRESPPPRTAQRDWLWSLPTRASARSLTSLIVVLGSKQERQFVMPKRSQQSDQRCGRPCRKCASHRHGGRRYPSRELCLGPVILSVMRQPPQVTCMRARWHEAAWYVVAESIVRQALGYGERGSPAVAAALFVIPANKVRPLSPSFSILVLSSILSRI